MRLCVLNRSADMLHSIVGMQSFMKLNALLRYCTGLVAIHDSATEDACRV